MVAFSLGPGWRAFGPAVIRVRTAKSAVASDHLLHAHFVGWQTAIVMKGMARTSARAPRHLSGLADAKVEQHCHSYGDYDEHESHGRLHPDDTGRFVPRSLSSRSNRRTTTWRQIQGSRDLPLSARQKSCAAETVASTSHFRSHRRRSSAEARRAGHPPTCSMRPAGYRAAIDPYRTTYLSCGCRRVFAASRRSARDRSRASRPKLRIRRDCE